MASDEMTKLLAELDAATREHADCESQEQACRSATCAAKNRLNKVQREIETRLAAMKKTAPRDSDWGQDRVARQPVETV